MKARKYQITQVPNDKDLSKPFIVEAKDRRAAYRKAMILMGFKTKLYKKPVVVDNPNQMLLFK